MKPNTTEESKGWKNPPKLEDLQQDLTNSTPAHSSQASKISAWLSNLNPSTETEKTNNRNPFSSSSNPKLDGRSKLQPKVIRKQAEWRYTALSEPFLNTVDIFNVEPVTYEDVAAAQQNGLILNNQFNTKLNRVKFIDTLVRTCVNEGTAIVRVGWDSRYKKVMTEYPIFEIRPATDSTQLQELQAASQVAPEELPREMAEALGISMDTGVPHYPVLVGTEEVEEEILIKNQPTLDLCDYENVYIDPSCGDDFSKAEFVIYAFESSKADLEKRGIYQNLDQVDANNTAGSADSQYVATYTNTGFAFKDKPRKKLIVHEYWGFWDIDGTGETKPIVATWVGDVLIRMEDNPYPDEAIPFVVIPYLPVKNSIYGEPDGELLLDNQKIKGALLRGMIDVMAKSANGQTGIRKGALDTVNKRRFERGLDYEFNEMGDGQNSIYMHTFPEIPSSAYNLVNMQDFEAESLTGVKAFSQGITGAGLGATAAAATGALDAAAKRELGILRRISEGMKEVGRKIIAMNQQFLSEEEVIRVTNQEFVPIRRDDLAGNFDLDLRISTAEADEQKAQELAFMLQTTSQSLGLEFTKIILAEIAQLRKMPYLAEQIKTFQQEPDPYTEQMKQLELMEKQTEIEAKRAEIQKILAEVSLTGYKASNVQADTDNKNLSFVEQESGTKHARELQKQGEQARANVTLKAAETLLKSRAQ